MTALRPLIFNLHRLIDRCSSPTPTGVDRVDFQHARFLLQLAQQEKRQIQFIRQQSSVAHLVPLSLAREIIHNLEQRWQQGKITPPTIQANKANYLRKLPVTWWHKHTNNLVTPAIKQAINNTPPPIYLHSGHGTLHHLTLHQQIQQTLNASGVYYLHDLIPIDFPEYTNNPKALQMHQRRMHAMATTGTLILANSQDSKQGFIRYCQKHNLPAPEIEALLIGVEERIISAAKQLAQPIPARYQQALQTPYFITIGTIEPRKNHILLLHLWRQLAQKYGEQCPKLVILGKRGWKIDNLIHLLDQAPALRKHVVEVNDASDQDMIALLQHSKALLFPSFAEGWGMPLAEALTLGTPAICADIPALHECGRENALYLDPLDGPGWKQAILQQLKQNNLSERTKGYIPDRWDNHLQKLKDHIHRLDNCS
ncbi:MAG: glycosyltransferase family 4 protein [Thiolinea sp.]